MKERLTGAIILVALIVLLVPELLSGPLPSDPAGSAAERTATARTGASPNEPPLRSYTLSLEQGAPRQAGLIKALAAPTPMPVAVKSPSSTAPPASHPETVAISKHSQPPLAPPAHRFAPAAAKSQAAARVRKSAGDAARAHPLKRVTRGHTPWVVQLGSFARRANAIRLERRVSAKGFRTHTVPARMRHRTLWRVLVGPVSDRAAGLRLARRLRARGFKGELLPR